MRRTHGQTGARGTLNVDACAAVRPVRCTLHTEMSAGTGWPSSTNDVEDAAAEAGDMAAAACTRRGGCAARTSAAFSEAAMLSKATKSIRLVRLPSVSILSISTFKVPKRSAIGAFSSQT